MTIHKTILQIALFGMGLQAASQESRDISWIEDHLTRKIQVAGEAPETYSIAQRMKQDQLPGVSIAVVHDGRLVYAKGFGTANAATGTKVTERTLFQAASISKPLAALAALKLVEQGKIDLDTDVNTYLKTWKIPENRFTAEEKVTLRRILTHTAGLTVHGFPGYSRDEAFPSTTDVLEGKGNTPAVTVDTIPGSIWRYSGGGYTVMQQLIKDVSGMELAEFAEKFIFPEMGMTESTFQQPLAGAATELASGAYDGQGKLYVGGWHNYPETAAAGLWTTPSDLARYCMHIQDIHSGRTEGVLSRETVAQMLTPYRNNYGLGLGLTNAGDSLLFGHNGKNAGFTNSMVAFANRGDAVVVMTNGDNGSRILEEVTRAVSDFYGWNIRQGVTVKPVSLSRKDLKKLTGSYSYEMDGETFIIPSKIGHGKVVLYDPGFPAPIRLVPLGNLEFIDPEHEVRIDFTLDDTGKVTGLLWEKQWFVPKNEDR